MLRGRSSALALVLLAGCQTPAPPAAWAPEQLPIVDRYVRSADHSVVRARIARVTPTRFGLSGAMPDGETVTLRVLRVDWSETLQEKEIVDLFNVPDAEAPAEGVPLGLLHAGEVRHVVIHHPPLQYSGASGRRGTFLTLVGPVVALAADNVAARVPWAQGAEQVGRRGFAVVRARVAAVKTVKVRGAEADHADLDLLAVEWSGAHWQVGQRIRAGDARAIMAGNLATRLFPDAVPPADDVPPPDAVPPARLAVGEERWFVVGHLGFVKLIWIASEPLGSGPRS